MPIVIVGPATVNTPKDQPVNIDMAQFVTEDNGNPLSFEIVTSTEAELNLSTAGVLTGKIVTCGAHEVVWKVIDTVTTEEVEETTPFPTYAPSGWPVGFLGVLAQ